jgi:hypothetical protein
MSAYLECVNNVKSVICDDKTDTNVNTIIFNNSLSREVEIHTDYSSNKLKNILLAITCQLLYPATC